MNNKEDSKEEIFFNFNDVNKTKFCSVDGFDLTYSIAFKTKKMLVNFEKIPTQKLSQIIQNNLIKSFFISGLFSKAKLETIPDSESYKSLCNHKECYDKNPSYKPKIIFCFQDKKNRTVEPNDFLAKLIFPTGIKICFQDVTDETIHLFQNVITCSNGEKYYLHSLLFYVTFSKNEALQFFPELTSPKSKIHIPFSFTVVTKCPSIKPFEHILTDLFFNYKFKAENTDNFDNELIHLLYEIPYLPSNVVSFYLPYKKVKFLLDEHQNNPRFKEYLLKHLSIESIVKIFALIISEHKIIFISESYNLIFNVIETFLELIFPLQWVSTYIPALTEDSLDYLQSFIPFLVGVSYEIFEKIDKSILESNEITIVDIDKHSTTVNVQNFEIPFYDELYNALFDMNYDDINNNSIKFLFTKYMLNIIGNYQIYTSIVGDNVLFNQTCFTSSKPKKYKQFFNDLVSSQQFDQFIRCSFDDLYSDFNNLSSKELPLIVYEEVSSESAEQTEYILYPYFISKENLGQGDLVKELSQYYKENLLKDTQYFLETEGYIRFSIIMQNYTSTSLRKYDTTSFNIDDSTLCFDTSFNISANSQPQQKTRRNSMISLKKNLSSVEGEDYSKETNLTEVPSNTERVPYRKQNSLFNMVLLSNKDYDELIKYQDQILELLRDYMAYILVNNRVVKLGLSEFSLFFQQDFIRKDFARILYQDKFNKGLYHELTSKTFYDLSKIILYCFINSKDDPSEYETYRLITKAMFFYFKLCREETEEKKKKYFLFSEILKSNITFEFWNNRNYWKHCYTEEVIANPLEENIQEKMECQMRELNLRQNFINYCKNYVFRK